IFDNVDNIKSSTFIHAFIAVTISVSSRAAKYWSADFEKFSKLTLSVRKKDKASLAGSFIPLCTNSLALFIILYSNCSDTTPILLKYTCQYINLLATRKFSTE